MTALNQDFVPRAWAQGWPRNSRRPANGTIATGKVIYQTSMSMEVDGIAQPCLSGAAMAALCLLAAGADANGGLYFSARTKNVRVKVTSSAAEKIVITYGATIDIDVQYNNGTSTAATVVQLLAQHAEASRLLRYKAQGTGASSPAALAFTAVPEIVLLGVPNMSADNSTGGSPLALGPSFTFDVGLFGAQVDANNVPPLNSIAFILDDNTFTSVADPLAFQVPIRLVDGHGLTYGALDEAR